MTGIYQPPKPWTEDELDLVFVATARWLCVMVRGSAAVYELHKAMPSKPVSEIKEMMCCVGMEMPVMQFHPPAPQPEYLA